jgi:hypothetical protein
MICGVPWLDSTPEAYCTREAGHANEHEARFELHYEFGQVGVVDISWKRERDAIDVPKADTPQTPADEQGRS